MAEPERVRLPARSTRGKRVSELVGEDLDADEEFWNQKAFQEEAEDVEYATEGEVDEDVFDSDFDDDEPENEEEEPGAEVKERPTKRRLLPPGTKKISKKPKKPAKAAKKGVGGRMLVAEKGKASGRVDGEAMVDGAEAEKGKSKAGKKSGVGKSRQRRELALLGVGRVKREGAEGGGGERREEREEGEEGEEGEELIGDATVDLTDENWGGGGGGREGGGREGGGVERRKSRRTAVVVKDMERQMLRAAREGVPKAVRKRKEGERRWTQEEMLLEAAQTEILNREALAVMLAREEEVKRKAVVEKAIFGGPQIRFHSKDGKNTLEFTKVAAVPPEINAKAPSYPAKATLAGSTSGREEHFAGALSLAGSSAHVAAMPSPTLIPPFLLRSHFPPALRSSLPCSVGPQMAGGASSKEDTSSQEPPAAAAAISNAQNFSIPLFLLSTLPGSVGPQMAGGAGRKEEAEESGKGGGEKEGRGRHGREGNIPGGTWVTTG
ncbi:unnamed protein product [Closterium sp. Naga37s-1]|nr:unnamed protein product [Closterium sp. Naga37s-1]